MMRIDQRQSITFTFFRIETMRHIQFLPVVANALSNNTQQNEFFEKHLYKNWRRYEWV